MLICRDTHKKGFGSHSESGKNNGISVFNVRRSDFERNVSCAVIFYLKIYSLYVLSSHQMVLIFWITSEQKYKGENNR